MQHRQSKGDDHPAGGRQHLLQGQPRHPRRVGAMEGVFAPVASQTQFRQAKQAHPFLPCLRDGGQNPPSIPLPIQRGLVQHSGADFYQFHRLPAASPRSYGSRKR